MQATDSPREQPRETIGRRGKGHPRRRGDEDARTYRRLRGGGKRAPSTTRAQQTKGEMEVRTDANKELQPERRWSGEGARQWDSKENVDVEGGTPGWSKSGNDEGHLMAGGGMPTEANTTSPKEQNKKN
jgi:hypothetical protein